MLKSVSANSHGQRGKAFPNVCWMCKSTITRLGKGRRSRKSGRRGKVKHDRRGTVAKWNGVREREESHSHLLMGMIQSSDMNLMNVHGSVSKTVEIIYR